MKQSVHVVKALAQRIAAAAQRTVGRERDLDRAQAPAAALADVFGQPFGGQAHAQARQRRIGIISLSIVRDEN
ncbi:hypothetical protein CF70_006595 [Cupriavidus sp. SK-3]|nr:hypothetical protein CF70_006595 [Cupriavidus sp. SK-3]